MSAIYIALPIALLLALVGVAAFIWSVRSGQMDDLETPALRVLGEEDERRAPSATPAAEESPTDETRGGSKT
jgi:cbb3-type cytochrome oxidase maturation protein